MPRPAKREARNRDRWGFWTRLRIETDGDPYLDRLRIVQTPLFSLYKHRIHRADIERDPHDHPWWFASIVFRGWYREVVRPDKRNPDESIIRDRRRWSLRSIGLNSAHKIVQVGEPLTTFVLTGPKRNKWGFWPGGQYVYWKDYQYTRPGEQQPDA